ncbi:MAG: FtsX-like permease family protein, partial [Gemmatimonadaceae bacterium]
DSMAIRPQLAVAAGYFTRRFVRPPGSAYELQLKSIRPKPPNLRDNELALLMVGIALGVLAIACVNVSALALARGLSRRRDYALRVALGASRRAIAGEVISEVGVLAVLGAIGGFMFAVALIGMMTHITPEDMRWRGLFEPELNARVFALTTLALIGGILVAGGVPAWRASRIDPSDPLKDNAGTTTGRGRSEFKVLVMGELAIAMALLMLASLMTLSTRNLMKFDFGFDARQFASAEISLWSAVGGRGDSLSSARKQDILYASLQRVRDMPGVVAVATTGWGRLDDDHITSDAGREAEPLRLRNGYTEAGAHFFSTLGVTMASGRDFSEGDDVTGAVILSRRAAALLFPHGDAVGRMVKLGGEPSSKPWLQVVGIAPDIHFEVPRTMLGETDTLVYAATARPVTEERLVIRPTRDDPALQLRIARTLKDGLPPKSMTQVGPLAGNYELSLRYQRFYDQLFSFLGTAALLLGAAGLFSVMSYTVGQRLREFAVRQALGATPADVARLVLRGALELALGGTAVGALLSFWASAGVSTALWGVKNTDPVSLVVAEATLLAVMMLASLVPAVRAMRADPVEVLRAT